MPRTPRPWFRLYSDVLDNLKVEELKPTLRWQWVKLLALANVTVPRGTLPPMKQVAYRLRTTETASLAVVLELVAHGLIDCTAAGYVMHDWDDWQKDRDVAPGKREGNGDIPHANVTPTREEYHTAPVKTRGERGEREKEEERDQRRGEGDPVDNIASDFAQFGKVTAGTAPSIGYSVEEHGLEWVRLAVRKAASSGAEDKPPWSYVESILERWKKQGGPDEPKESSNGRTTKAGRHTASGSAGGAGADDVAAGWLAEAARKG